MTWAAGGSEIKGGRAAVAPARAPYDGMVNVAFAGHIRDSDLVDVAVCTARIQMALALLRAAGIGQGRLIVGAADGADAIATQAWSKAGAGPVHIAHPFLEGAPVPGAAGETWLDGKRALSIDSDPHLDQTRWLLAYADLVIVLWNGAAARGAGGTADIVTLGLQAGTPILWVSTDPDDTPIRLLRSAYPGADVLELRAAVLSAKEAPPADAASLATCLDLRHPFVEGRPPSVVERIVGRTVWRSFALFRRGLGSPSPTPPEPPPPPDLQAQPGFVALTRLADETSEQASRLSDAHRSAQVLLLVIALAATILGASPIVFPAAKPWSSLAELLLLLIGMAILLGASRTHRHDQWTALRCEAEHLRSLRVAWVLGLSAPSQSTRGALVGVTPPTGAYDRERVRTWGTWALFQLIGGQEAYHAEQAVVGHRISRRMDILESSTFGGLLVSLAILSLAHLLHANGVLPPPLTAAMSLIAAIGPAIGAACMTLEARFGFEEQRGRSLDLAERFHRLAERIPPDGALPQLQPIAHAAMLLVSHEAQVWRHGSGRRRLSRGA